ncbi:uncharacterized protein LOC128214075 [Mya arenaria]|uniref:uncharacterized protein LOC128214075 n=1 Tax=Mya arenaria TaxID=6604 RepID=UPI0022E92764|nr:uncharacterized protein LOC128214075 [Mya arenaria]
MNLISFLSVVLLVMHLQASIFAQILWTIIPPDKLKFDLRPNNTRIKPFTFRTTPLVSPARDLVGGAGRITWHLSGTNKTINRTMSWRDGQGTQGDVGVGQQRNTRISWVVNHSPKTELSGQVGVRLNIGGEGRRRSSRRGEGGRRRSSRRGGGGRRHLSRGDGGGGEGDRLKEAKSLEEAQ